MIERDVTQRSVVVTCACGARELVGTPDQADTWAVAHLRRHVELDREHGRRRAIAAAAARQRRRDTPS